MKGKEVSALSYLQGPDTGVRPFGAQGNNSGNSPLPSVELQREEEQRGRLVILGQQEEFASPRA